MGLLFFSISHRVSDYFKITGQKKEREREMDIVIECQPVGLKGAPEATHLSGPPRGPGEMLLSKSIAVPPLRA